MIEEIHEIRKEKTFEDCDNRTGIVKDECRQQDFPGRDKYELFKKKHGEHQNTGAY
jgi:hypothetical protein